MQCSLSDMQPSEPADPSSAPGGHTWVQSATPVSVCSQPAVAHHASDSLVLYLESKSEAWSHRVPLSNLHMAGYSNHCCTPTAIGCSNHSSGFWARSLEPSQSPDWLEGAERAPTPRASPPRCPLLFLLASRCSPVPLAMDGTNSFRRRDSGTLHVGALP